VYRSVSDFSAFSEFSEDKRPREELIYTYWWVLVKRTMTERSRNGAENRQPGAAVRQVRGQVFTTRTGSRHREWSDPTLGAILLIIPVSERVYVDIMALILKSRSLRITQMGKSDSPGFPTDHSKNAREGGSRKEIFS